jgi:ribosomal protein S6--L-glutamate ligase
MINENRKSTNLGFDRTVGLWMYQNGGGTAIEEKLINLLKEREIDTITGLDLRFAEASNSGITLDGIAMDQLDLFFSYNAGEQTQMQVYYYEQLNRYVKTMNSFEAFRLSEDKLATNLALAKSGVRTSEFYLSHRERPEAIKEKLEQWGKMVFKPLDGWGGTGMALIENEAQFDMLMPFLNNTDIRHIFVERFIKNDFTDYRVDIVDGQFVSVYGRKAGSNDWRTNVSAGGSVIMREPNDELIDIATRAVSATGLDIAGVDIIYDLEREEYVVLEVNGIPAFATPDQEEFGLDFNDRKLELIANLIDRKTKQ